jgi:hypothetical protein
LRELDIEIYDTQDSKTRIKTLHIRRKKEDSKMPLEPFVPLEHVINNQTESKNPGLADPLSSGIMDNTSGIDGKSNGINDDSKMPLGSQESEIEDSLSENDDDQPPNGKSDTNGIDIDKIQIVNVSKGERCDAYLGRKWKLDYGPPPVVGADGKFGNPFVLVKEGQEPTEPWQCKTREEALDKHEEWVKRGTEVVNGYDPKKYRRALKELIGCYKWGCHCAPLPCHCDFLKRYLKRKVQIWSAHETYKQKHTKDSTKGGETK